MKKKGKLIIEQNKKGKLNYKAVTEDGKTTSIFGIEIPTEYNHKNAEFELDNGRIVKVIFDDGKIFEVQKTNNKSDRIENKNNMHRNNQPQNQTKEAIAPYNFVPLNECVVKAQDPPPFDRYYDNRYTGYIDLTIETLTPLYIRNTIEIGKSDPDDFFNVNGQYKIPGSSLRGMIRTLVEIVSFGKFHYFDDDRLYYRGLADVSNLKNYYNNKIRNNVKAGYLNYDNGKKKFYITPAESINGKQYVTFKDTRKEFSYEPQNDGSWKVWTGKVGNRKRNNWIINPPEKANEIELSKEDASFYKNDKNRNIPIDIIKSAQKKCLIKDGRETSIKFNEGVPIFYVECKDSQKNKPVAFGHTRYFRLPYEKTIGDHIPQNLKNNDTTDLADAIFGKEDKWASRVFFEDADLDNPENAFLQKTSPKILSGPKPTTFQHYLEQPDNANKNNLKHWDDDAKIRGYKLYWHRKTSSVSNDTYSWNEGKVIQDDKQHTIIRPVKENKEFKGRIRFENLSKEELGALLFVLYLPENCHHKLGMGKPLGLGSVKISPQLFIIDKTESYRKLFDDKQNNLFISLKEIKNTDEFTSAFEKYILDNISRSDKGNATKLWDTPRLKELKHLLDWSKINIPDWNEKTRYMEIEHEERGKKINEFKNRPVLNRPSSYSQKI